MARLALHCLQESDDPHRAAKDAIDELANKVNGVGGVILLSPDGRPGWYHNTPYMALAYCAAGMDAPVVMLT
jgi:isoaspartyl peptidase/L-asparaginase-like protein (Ntn-hydrolase superfamily)